MKLLGAREFIKMPAGTFYVQYWQNSKKECIDIIENFKKEPKSFLELKVNDLEVFGDNSGSMTFGGDIEDNYIFYYDANVVGDASPATTLYLVIDEDELPDIIEFHNNERNTIQLKKNEVIKIKNIFLNDYYVNSKTNANVFNLLHKLSKETGSIVDINITYE